MTEVLFVEKAPTVGAEHRLEDGATIGRAGCDVVVDDPDVSRRHAIMRLKGSGIAIEDLGSKNGTFVNDVRIDVVTELRDGDCVRFGDVVWEVKLRQPIQATRAAPTVPPAETPTPAKPVHGAEAPHPELTVVPPTRIRRRAADPGRNESRGDVPVPDFAPSQVPRVVPADEGASGFSPAGGRFKRSAARRVEATIVSYGVVLATAVAIAVYFAQR